jgi:trans-2,3-dihydro-3-hydroxyanthranilate isomerase
MPMPQRRFRFVQLDVFTDRVFGGNQLAVFTDAEGLADDEMLAIAREMNYSETTFVLPAKQSDALCRVRIFTPSVELPFAGHPVVGTALALAADGRIAPKAETALSGDQAIARFELGVGTLPVEVHFTDGRPDFVWMTQPLPSFTPWTGQPARMAAAIGVPSDALALESFPIEWGSAGVAFLFVPLRSAADLAAAHPSPELFAHLVDGGEIGTYLFATQGASPGRAARARLFAPGVGITEDAATGSAAGPLGAYLWRHGQIVSGADGTAYGILEQGIEMGRPSQIHVELAGTPSQVMGVRVGGRAVMVAEGTLSL